MITPQKSRRVTDSRAPLYPAQWWAHLEFTRINIKLTVLPKKIEDLRETRAQHHAANWG